VFEPDLQYRLPGAALLRRALRISPAALALSLLVILLGLSNSPRAQTPVPGLVAAYSFDEGTGTSAADGSGNNLTGALANVTWASPGRFGNALLFNGTSGWVTVNDTDALDLTTGMTLEAWVFPTALGSGVWREVLIKERPGGEVFNLYANADTNGPAIFVVPAGGGGPVALRGTSPLALNTWTHLAATYSNAALQLYVNGVLVASRALTGPLLTSPGALRIGGNSQWGEFFQGSIDEVRIYNRALTQAEIQADMVTPLGTASPVPPGADRVGQWSQVMNWPLVAVHMSLLPSGQLLVWDGFDAGPRSARLWDPITNTFTAVPNVPNIFCAGHALMPDGRLLVAGGHLGTAIGIRDTEIFDPATRAWTSGSPMAFARWYPTVTTLPDGRAIVMSGTEDCLACLAEIPEVYDPGTDRWTRLDAARRRIPLYPFNFVLPDGRLLVAGGYHDSMATDVLDLTTQTWSTLDPTILDAGSAVMYTPGRIMKSGSSWEQEFTSNPSAATTYVLDTTQPSPRWRQTAPMAFARVWHTLTVLPDGNVLVTGGGQSADYFDVDAASLAAEMWSPTTETWTTLASGQIPRFYHSVATLLPDGRVVVAGGGRGGVDHLNAEIYSPPYLFKGARPTIASAPSEVAYGHAFTVQTPDAARIAKVSLVGLGSVTHAFNANQRFVPLSFQANAGTLTVQAPANGNLAPPGPYMLFVVDTSGVPSVAAVVRLPTPSEDIVPPTVAVTAPAANVTVSGTITLSASASDNVGIAGVRFQVNGVNVGAEDAASPYSITWNSASVPDGSHTITAIARDAAGNAVVSAGISVTVGNADVRAPTTPTAVKATAVSPSRINVSWTASTDEVGVAGYTVRRDGMAVATVTGTSHADTGLQPATTYQYTVVAFDSAGNTSPASSPPASATTVGAGPGLIAAWSFDEGTGASAADATGHGHAGAISGATWTTQGRFGNALSFDGLNDWVTVGSSALLDLSSGMTVQAWVFPTATSGIRDVLLKEGPSADIYNLYARNWRGLPESNVFVGGSNKVAEGATLPANVWTHLAGTYDGSAVRLFVNGVQVGSAPISGAIATSSGVLRIGGNSLWGEFFQGRIDEVRIYNRALTAAEIQTDMVTPVGGTTAPDTTPPGRSGGLPTGTLAAGTTQATLSLTTSESASCRYATTAGVPYASMAGTFTTTGATAHSTTVAGLASGGSYSYHVRCQDGAGNANTSDFTISFTVAQPADTTPPVRSSGLPTGPLAAGTTQATLSLATDENATCRYATTAGTVYAAMSSTFATTGTTTHSTNVSVVSDGAAYTFHVRCQDAAGNPNTTDFTIGFSVALPADLVAAYGFNEGAGTTVADASGRGHTGTISGATWTTQGRFGPALSFDGANDWVTIDHSALLSLTTGMTLEAWVLPTAPGTTWRNVLIKERLGVEVYNLYAGTETGVPATYVVSAGPSAPLDAVGVTAVPVDTWTHLAATYDGTTLRLHVNGVEAGSRPVSGALVTSTGALRIGGNSIWGEFFQGQIDEVRIYSRALSAAEIQADMTRPIAP
jgi:chitodextrinase